MSAIQVWAVKCLTCEKEKLQNRLQSQIWHQEKKWCVHMRSFNAWVPLVKGLRLKTHSNDIFLLYFSHNGEFKIKTALLSITLFKLRWSRNREKKQMFEKARTHDAATAEGGTKSRFVQSNSISFTCRQIESWTSLFSPTELPSGPKLCSRIAVFLIS